MHLCMLSKCYISKQKGSKQTSYNTKRFATLGCKPGSLRFQRHQVSSNAVTCFPGIRVGSLSQAFSAALYRALECRTHTSALRARFLGSIETLDDTMRRNMQVETVESIREL
eukprot:4081890-Amphidinium_carterae.1